MGALYPALALRPTSPSNPRPRPRFVLCIDDGGYVDDLKVRAVYQVVPDESAAASNYLRVIDETGEDDLYPATLFVPIEVPQEAEPILVRTS